MTIKASTIDHDGSTWHKTDSDKMTRDHLQSGAPDPTVTYKLSANTLAIGLMALTGMPVPSVYRRKAVSK